MRLQIIPNYSIDNKKTLGLLENLHFYKNILQRVNIKSDKEKIYINLKKPHVIVYEILLSRDDVSFLLTFDDALYENIITELNICWSGATFKPCKQHVIVNGVVKELELVEHYFLSLKTDRRAEYPLSNILETQNILRGNEKVLIRLELMPVSFTYYRELEECIKNFGRGIMPTKTILDKKELFYGVANFVLDGVYNIIDFFNELISDEKIEHERINKNRYAKLFRNGLSKDTKEKSKYNGYRTRIIITVSDSARPDILLRNIFKAFNSMAGDNSFIMVDKSNYKNILSSKELSQIIQMPTKYYQESYCIGRIDNREMSIPSELLEQGILLGTATSKGKTYDVYYASNINVRSLPKIVIGIQGSGKTSFAENFVVSSYKYGDANVVLDFIQDNELSKKIERHIPKKDLVIIDVSDVDRMVPLAYIEAYNLLQKSPDTWTRKRVANILAAQFEYFLNSITGNYVTELTPRMQRYLYACAMAVFIHPDKTLSDVIECMRSWQTRSQYIRLAKYSGCFDNDLEILSDLEELHERDDKTGRIIGTREDLIRGIIDRVTVLKKNLYVREMLNAPIDPKQDFIKFIEQGKTVLVRIPQTVFPDVSIRDTLATYFVSRIWLAVQLREQTRDMRLSHLLVDEIHHTRVCADFIKNHVCEFRRHRLGTFFSVHYLKQFGSLLDAVKSSGASYSILAGTEKENIKMLEQEIKPFTIEEVMSLKKFHALNIINYGNQYCKFISRLPKPLA